MRRFWMLSLAALAAGAPGRPFAAPQPDSVPDLLVTARQRPEPAQRAPLAVRALGEERIAQLRPVQLSDLSAAAPNFSVEKVGGVDTVLIRGAGGGGRNIGFGARTAVYLDDVYIGQPNALNQSIADAERVEILRGPQGTLSGRNTVSGAVNIVSREPGREPGAAARAWIGNRASGGVFAAVDAPIDPNGIRARASVFAERRDGFTRNTFDGSRDLGSIDLTSMRVTIAAEPAPALRLDVSADYTRDDSQRDAFEADSNPVGAGVGDPFAPAPFEIRENTPRLRRYEQFGSSLRGRYTLSDGSVLTSISAYRVGESRRRSDNDYSPLDLLATDFADRFGQASEELRLASPSGRRLRYVAGLFYMDDVRRSRRIARFGSGTLAAGLPVPPGGAVPLQARLGARSTAAFLSFDYDFAPKWTASLGARLSHERRTLVFDLDGSQSGALRIATLTGFRDRQSDTRLTPAISLTYAPQAGVSLYGRYAEGFKGGGWNVDFLSTAQVNAPAGAGRTPFAFRPEDVRSVEGGIKAALFERRARVDLTAFSMWIDDYQVNKLIAYPGGVSVIQLTNASMAKSSGLEFSGDLRATDFLQLTLDAAVLRARFGAFPGGGVGGADATGNRLPFAPRFSFGIGAELTPGRPVGPGQASLYVDYRYRSFVYTGQENLATESIAGYGVVNARLSWRPDHGGLEFALWCRNLADRRYLTNRVRDFLGTRTLTRGDPRTYGAELSARF